MLRVGFDGRALGSPAAGVRRYASELFGAMARREDVTVVAVGAAPGMPLSKGIERAAAGATLPTNLGWMTTGLPRGAARAGVDLFHAPSYTAPAGGPRPLVLTIHDVSYERHPEWYPYRRDPVRRAFYRWSARTADRIITDSAFSRGEIVAAYSLCEERIDVVPLAAAAIFTPGKTTDPHGDPYLLHVGDLHPRRNLAIAVRAVREVRRMEPLQNLRLVLAGVDRGVGATLTELGGATVEMRGKIPDDTLLALYRGAAALVYPSKYEGFGIPVLEAMACGTPVIAARAGSIPEVAGDAAILLDPDDERGWIDAITAVAAPGSPRAQVLRAAGIARAATFTWERTAEQTLEVYRRAIGGLGGWGTGGLGPGR